MKKNAERIIFILLFFIGLILIFFLCSSQLKAEFIRTYDLIQDGEISKSFDGSGELKVKTIDVSDTITADTIIAAQLNIVNIDITTLSGTSAIINTITANETGYIKNLSSDSIITNYLRVDGTTNLLKKTDSIYSDSIQTYASKIVYVDKNRTDTYNADGTILKPFKLLSDAIVINPDKIYLSSGVYDGNGLSCGSSLEGIGTGKTTISGNITFTAGNKNISNLSFTDAVIFNDAVACNLIYFTGSVKLLSGVSQFINSHIITSNTTALTIEGVAGLNINISSITTTGNYSAINHNSSGQLNIVSGSITNSSASAATINKTNGILILNNTQVINGSLGLSIKCDAGTQNVFNGIIYAGNIQAGTITTIIEGNYAPYGSSISGTNLIYRSASQIQNTPTGNITDTNIQGAVNKLDIIKLNTADSIVISKVSELQNDSNFASYNDTLFFQISNNNTIYADTSITADTQMDVINDTACFVICGDSYGVNLMDFEFAYKIKTNGVWVESSQLVYFDEANKRVVFKADINTFTPNTIKFNFWRVKK